MSSELTPIVPRLGSGKKLYFGDNQTQEMYYNATAGILVLPTSIGVEDGTLNIYTNSNADGSGQYLPSINISNNEIDISTDTVNATGGNEINLDAGVVNIVTDLYISTQNAVNQGVNLRTNNVSSTTTHNVEFPDAAGTLYVQGTQEDFRFQHDGGHTSSVTISTANQIVGADTSGGVLTVTLASSMVAAGAWIIVNDEGGSAGGNAITIDTEGSETIDGGSSITIGTNNGTAKVYSNGTNWFTF